VLITYKVAPTGLVIVIVTDAGAESYVLRNPMRSTVELSPFFQTSVIPWIVTMWEPGSFKLQVGRDSIVHDEQLDVEIRM
jgi:hypothetical protein